MRDELATALRDVDVVVVACYETQRVTLDDAGRAALAAADAVLVGAPSAWSVLRDDVAASAWVVVPGPTTAEVVRATHPRVLEGWGPSLRERLLASASDAER
jgi:uroporphyrinogen-III synthase